MLDNFAVPFGKLIILTFQLTWRIVRVWIVEASGCRWCAAWNWNKKKNTVSVMKIKQWQISYCYKITDIVGKWWKTVHRLHSWRNLWAICKTVSRRTRLVCIHRRWIEPLRCQTASKLKWLVLQSVHKIYNNSSFDYLRWIWIAVTVRWVGVHASRWRVVWIVRWVI